MTWNRKPFYRVEDGYCTCCHQEGEHAEDCPVVIWAKEEEVKTDKQRTAEQQKHVPDLCSICEKDECIDGEDWCHACREEFYEMQEAESADERY